MNIVTSTLDMYYELLSQQRLLFGVLMSILGLLLGSFLNVVALRIPKKESFVYPPSHCVHCKHRLGPADLVPVFSYLFLLGRCRYCKERISPLYPFGEALTACMFGVVAWKLGPVPELLPGLFMAAILSAITVTDLRYMLIPDKIVAFAVAVGLLLRWWIHPLPLWQHLISMLIGGGILYLIAWSSIVLLKKEGMGGGDIKLFVFIGLMLGPSLTLLTLFAASLLGTVYGLLQLILGRLNREKPMPFGPFICFGAMLCYLWGQRAIDAYLQLILM